MVNRRQKILILIDSLKFGGAEKQVISLINHMDSKKYDVTLGYLNDKDDLLHQITKNRTKATVCFQRKRRFDISVLVKIKKMCQSEKYDHVFCIDAVGRMLTGTGPRTRLPRR